MPHEWWFPEFLEPLGAPEGPATTDPDRNNWTRKFAHATVSVNLRNRINALAHRMEKPVICGFEGIP